MNILELIFEDTGDITPTELLKFKSAIADRIKQLPDDPVTAKLLREIEDILAHVHAGGKMGMINNELSRINDDAVNASQKELARYIASIDASPEDREEFFSLWREDKILKIDVLLSKQQHTFSEIFNKYDSNAMLREFIDEIMKVDNLGHGKGEFGLNVLSKSVGKSVDNKGDLIMKTADGIKKIECKTTLGGAARFGDQEVRPAEGYEQSAVSLNKFVSSRNFQVSGSGLNLNQAIEFYQTVQPSDKLQFFKLVKNTIVLIFGGLTNGNEEPLARLKDNVDDLLTAIKAGNNGAAAQAWAQASFNYYMSKKEDDGILYMDLRNNTCLFYNDANDLLGLGLRFHAKTPYLSATKDPGRSAYPQIEVVKTTFGAGAAAKSLPKKTKKTDEAEFFQMSVQWANKFASQRGVTDRKTIQAMAAAARELILAKVPGEELVANVEKQFPQLRKNLPPLR